MKEFLNFFHLNSITVHFGYFCFSDVIYMYDICILFAESFESESTTIVTLCS